MIPYIQPDNPKTLVLDKGSHYFRILLRSMNDVLIDIQTFNGTGEIFAKIYNFPIGDIFLQSLPNSSYFDYKNKLIANTFIK